MSLVWEQERETGGGSWGLYDGENLVGEIYPLGDGYRWREEASDTRRIASSLEAAKAACQASYEAEKRLLVRRGAWPPNWLYRERTQERARL
jgi:hypothetical protein